MKQVLSGTGSPDCDLTIEMFKRSAEALQLKYIGAATAKAYDIGDVKNDKIAKDSIFELAVQINKDAKRGCCKRPFDENK